MASRCGLALYRVLKEPFVASREAPSDMGPRTTSSSPSSQPKDATGGFRRRASPSFEAARLYGSSGPFKTSRIESRRRSRLRLAKLESAAWSTHRPTRWRSIPLWIRRSHSPSSDPLQLVRERREVHLDVGLDGYQATDAGRELIEVAARVETELLADKGRVLGHDARIKGPIRVCFLHFTQPYNDNGWRQ